MMRFKIDAVTGANAGVAREWALCRYYGIERTAHDHTPYDKGSDIEVGGLNISVKASRFSLMAGTLCEGRDTVESIWTLYAERVHSNRFAYVTKDFTVYLMTLDEFGAFVHKFCTIEHESTKNGGRAKVKCRHESRAMLEWLAANAA